MTLVMEDLMTLVMEDLMTLVKLEQIFSLFNKA